MVPFLLPGLRIRRSDPPHTRASHIFYTFVAELQSGNAKWDLTQAAASRITSGGLSQSGGGMLVRDFIFWLAGKKRVTTMIARRGMKYGFARRFVAGESLGDALSASEELCRQGRAVSLNHLGENVSNAEAAGAARDSYIAMVRELEAKHLQGNISIKLTQLGLDLDLALCQSLASKIASVAAALGRTIEMDMEGSAYTDKTLDIFEAVQREHQNVGLAIQAYLFPSEKDIARLAPPRPTIPPPQRTYP